MCASVCQRERARHGVAGTVRRTRGVEWCREGRKGWKGKEREGRGERGGVRE